MGDELTQPFIVNLCVVERERVVRLSLGTKTIVKIGTGLFYFFVLLLLINVSAKCPLWKI